jgi:hypothetical protein
VFALYANTQNAETLLNQTTAIASLGDGLSQSFAGF